MLLENILSIIWGENYHGKVNTTSKYYINRSIWVEDRRSPNNKKRRQKSLKSRKVTSDKNPYIVTSSLLSKSRAILGELWNKNLAKNVKKIDIGVINFSYQNIL